MVKVSETFPSPYCLSPFSTAAIQWKQALEFWRRQNGCYLNESAEDGTGTLALGQGAQDAFQDASTMLGDISTQHSFTIDDPIENPASSPSRAVECQPGLQDTGTCTSRETGPVR